MPLPIDKDLDLVFCTKRVRTVSNDNNIQFYGQTIQIPPSKIAVSLDKRKVDVCMLDDNRIFVLYKNNLIAESKLSKNNKILKKEKDTEKLLNQRQYISVM